MSKNGLIVLAKVLAILGIASAFVFYSCSNARAIRNEVRDQNRAREVTAYAVSERAAGYETVSFASLADAGHPGDAAASSNAAVDRIARTIASGHRHTEVRIDDACMQALFRAAAEFVYHRFVVTDHGRYVDWRLAEGYRFRDRTELYGRALIGEDHEILFGTSLAEDAPLRETFVRFADHHRGNWGPVHTPVGLATDPKSALVLIREIDPVVGAGAVSLGSAELDAYWLATRMGRHRNWFQGRPSGLERYRSGVVGLTLEHGDGRRRTVLIGFWSPAGTCDWRLTGLSQLALEISGGLIDY
ncbi:MAG: hypothetical protein LAT64_05175 [Phycisphaerales bacterium]|nr:hypothetical protein [Planctomycetota bacterium]MCH8508148.1 hypothetical protein [Phycisphaerales bacterium]